MKEKSEHGIIPQPGRKSESNTGPAYLHVTENGVVLNVRVQPRSSRESVEEAAGGILKVRVNAPPVEGAANEACRALLAEFFGFERKRVEILSGLKSREKRILLRGAGKEHVLNAISTLSDRCRK